MFSSHASSMSGGDISWLSPAINRDRDALSIFVNDKQDTSPSDLWDDDRKEVFPGCSKKEK